MLTDFCELARAVSTPSDTQVGVGWDRRGASIMSGSQESWALAALRLGRPRPAPAHGNSIDHRGHLSMAASLAQALSSCFRSLTTVLGTRLFLSVVLLFLPASRCGDGVGGGKDKK